MEISRKSIPLQSMCIFLSCIISMKLLLSIHTRPQRQFQAFRAYINNNFNTFNYLPFLFFYCIPQKTFLKSETELSIYTITAKHHELYHMVPFIYSIQCICSLFVLYFIVYCRSSRFTCSHCKNYRCRTRYGIAARIHVFT